MKIKMDVDLSAIDAAKQRLPSAAKKAEHALAIYIAKDTARYVPMLTGSLVSRTRVVENTIIYPGPYARYLYYSKVMVDASTGEGAYHYVNRHNEDVFFFRRGAKLKATERDLVFTTDFHPDAQSHWIEVSAAANREKWNRYGSEELLKALGQ